MNTGWWDTAFLWGLGVALVVGFLWGGVMAFKQEAANQQPQYDPDKYRS